jgi:hypothetical protein
MDAHGHSPSSNYFAALRLMAVFTTVHREQYQ